MHSHCRPAVPSADGLLYSWMGKGMLRKPLPSLFYIVRHMCLLTICNFLSNVGTQELRNVSAALVHECAGLKLPFVKRHLHVVVGRWFPVQIKHARWHLFVSLDCYLVCQQFLLDLTLRNHMSMKLRGEG